ncbi:MAG: hypothetical protein KF841_16370 [Phycisphaerae bacterium]|nr:hypothetical protein [Phycisphaerae bacterium]
MKKRSQLSFLSFRPAVFMILMCLLAPALACLHGDEDIIDRHEQALQAEEERSANVRTPGRESPIIRQDEKPATIG